jgi:hypothetical protein
LSTTRAQGVDPGGELGIDRRRSLRYDKVMDAVTGADLKASIIATVQAAALGVLLATATPDTLTAPNRVLFVAAQRGAVVDRQCPSALRVQPLRGSRLEDRR